MSEFVIDTDHLFSFADRTNTVIDRLNITDQRIYNLYSCSGLLGLAQLIQHGYVGNEIRNLKRIYDYLIKTASEIKAIETELERVESNQYFSKDTTNGLLISPLVATAAVAPVKSDLPTNSYNILGEMGETIHEDIQGIREIFKLIDDNYEKIPEPYRNLIKHLILDQIKYNDVSLTDIYDILDDIITGNFSWGTVSDIIGVGADLAGKKSTFIMALTTTLKIWPTYQKKIEALREKEDRYFDEKNYFAYFYTAIVGEGTVIIQGATDGLCKIIDKAVKSATKTISLSDYSDILEVASGGEIDIGGYLNTGGNGISDAIDYMTDYENFDEIGRAYKKYYGPVFDTIANAADGVADIAVESYKNTCQFFMNLF